MHPVERESQSSPARLMASLGDRLPYINFYRFCQLLEQSQPDKPVTGSTWQVKCEPVRFRPHPGMGFPVSEIKSLEPAEHPHLPPTVRVTFMGLYG
ncbi:type VI secretion system baseplate subunit TssG, partial [Serratia ureilytica]